MKNRFNNIIGTLCEYYPFLIKSLYKTTTKDKNNVCIQDYNDLEEKVKSVLGKYPLFCLTEGKKVNQIIYMLLTLSIYERIKPIRFIFHTDNDLFVGYGNKAIYRMEQRKCCRIFS